MKSNGKIALSFVLLLAMVAIPTVQAMPVSITSQRSGSWGMTYTWAPSKTGTITVSNGSNAVTGSGTAFTSQISLGDSLVSSTGVVLGQVQSVSDDGNLILTANASIDYSGSFYSGTVPVAGSYVVIDNTHTVSLSAGQSCTNCIVNTGGTLDAGTFTLSVSGVFTLQSGATFKQGGTVSSTPGASSRSLDNASTFIFYGSQTGITTNYTFGNLIWNSSSNGTPSGNLQINGNLTLTANTALRGSTGSTSSRTHTVVGNVYINGTGTGCMLVGSNGTTNGTWNIAGNVTVSGSCRLIGNTSSGTTGTGTFNIDGNLVVNSSTATIEFGSNSGCSGKGVINLKGNVLLDGKIWQNLGTGSLAINFVGTSAQSITSPGATGYIQAFSTAKFKIGINNPAGVTASMTLPVNDTLTLTEGLLSTSSAALLTFDTCGTAVGGSPTSFVNGPLVNTWTTSTATKSYPLGKGSVYRPLAITLTTPSSPIVQAEVFNANAGGTSALNAISTVRYYKTSLVSGTATSGGTVQITFGNDDGVTSGQESNLVVAQSSTVNGTYATLGQSANSSTTVTSNSYDPANGDFLVLGSTVSNPLPVEMSSFSANVNRLSTHLNWTTATEVNNFGFDIERKTSSSMWAKVGFVPGAGSSNEFHNYSFTDEVGAAGTYEYRLKQIDKTGGFKYSSVMQVEVGAVAKELSLGANYPNPFNPVTNVEFSVPSDGRATLKVYNMLGQEVATLFDGIAQPGRLIKATFDASRLSSGIYFSRLQYGERALVQRMMLVK